MEATKKNKVKFAGDGIIIFHDVAGAMKGERALRAPGYDVKLVAPLPELRTGCDLALEINLEPIGGTGDTITGLVSGLVYAGLEPKDAAIYACRTNRMAGLLAQPTPATKVKEIIDQFSTVATQNYCSWSGVCEGNTLK